MKRTPLHDSHLKQKAEMVEFAGWEMPIRYTTLVEEHQAVRNQAGLFDVSHMGEVRITGPDAEKFVQHIFTNDVAPMEDTQILYGYMLYETGGVVDDLLVYKYNKEHYYLVINASNVDKDFAWMQSQSKDYDVLLENVSSEVAEVALQGPKAQEILQKLTDTDLSEIKFFYFKDHVTVAGKDALISRTGYTGEDGFEIYMSNDDAEHIWDEILKAGAEDIKPAGLGARDTLRFEAGLPLYGNELSDSVTPIESGFGYFVSKEADFIGSDVIRKEREEGSKRKTVGLEVLGRGIIRHGYPVYSLDGTLIGSITTGYQAPTVGKTIALALIDAEYAKLGTEVEVEVRNKKVKAVQISKKFLKKNTKSK